MSDEEKASCEFDHDYYCCRVDALLSVHDAEDETGDGGGKAVSVMIGRHDMDVGIVTGRMGSSTATTSMVVWRRMRRRWRSSIVLRLPDRRGYQVERGDGKSRVISTLGWA